MDFEGLIWFHVMGCLLGLSEGCRSIPPFLMYAIPAMTVAVALAGFYVWRRVIKTRPVVSE